MAAMVDTFDCEFIAPSEPKEIAESYPTGDDEVDALSPHTVDPPLAKLNDGTKRKIAVVKDTRGVAHLMIKFPHVSVELLARLMEQYESYTTVVDVVRALGNQLNRVAITAEFWDRQHWPRPGQPASMFSWSVVDSVESYDMVHGHHDQEEEDEWLDALDEKDFMHLQKSEPDTAVGSVCEKIAKPVVPEQPKRVGYNEVLLRQPAHRDFIRTAPRIPPLVHMRPLKIVDEDKECDDFDDSEDEGMESVIYREHYVMKNMAASARRNSRLHVSPDVLAKKQQRLEQRIAAIHRYNHE